MWVGGVELSALGSVTKRFFRGPRLLLSCFLTVALVGKEGQRRVTCRERFRAAFVTSPPLFTVIHAVLFMAMYCAVKWKWRPGRASSTYKMYEMPLRPWKGGNEQ